MRKVDWTKITENGKPIYIRLRDTMDQYIVDHTQDPSMDAETVTSVMLGMRPGEDVDDESTWSVSTVTKLADYAGNSVSYLLGEDDDQPVMPAAVIDEVQEVIDAAKETAYVLGVMAESKERVSGDFGESETLHRQSSRLFNAVDEYEQTDREERGAIHLSFNQDRKLAKALGIDADELADAIAKANGEEAQS